MSDLDEALMLLQALLVSYVETVDAKCEWDPRSEQIVVRVNQFLQGKGKDGVQG